MQRPTTGPCVELGELMKNSTVSGILATALGLAACGDDAHEVDLSDASQDEITMTDAGGRPGGSNSNPPAADPGGISALTDLLGGLLLGGGLGGLDAGLDVGAICGFVPQLCQTDPGMPAADAGRGDREPRDAGPRDGGPGSDGGAASDAAADAAADAAPDGGSVDAGSTTDAEPADAANVDAAPAPDASAEDAAQGEPDASEPDPDAASAPDA
jgi:hypothetical protein